MASTALGLILLASAASASWFSPESPEFRQKVFTYAGSLYTDAGKRDVGTIGKLVIQYGRTFTNCLKETERTAERNALLPELQSHAITNNMKETITGFYKYFILPEGEDKRIFLSMVSPCIKDTESSFPIEDDHYILESKNPQIRVPVEPNFDLSQSECGKIDLFLERTNYRVQNYQYELEFYTLSIFVLENFPDTEKELQNPHKLLLSYRRYLRDHMRNYGNRKLEQIFCDFMALRDRKQETIEKDLAESTEPEKTAELESQLTFHRQASKMMLRGWMRVNRLSNTDGKLWIADHNLKTRRSYDVSDN